MPEASKLFNAPVPGASLTAAKGASPYEYPPEFTSVEDAADYLFVEMTKPRRAIELIELLKSGMSCEELARTIAFVGAAGGKWTPDVMLPLARDKIIFILAAIGQRHKVKNIKYMSPDDAYIENLLNIRNNSVNSEPTDKEVLEGAAALNNVANTRAVGANPIAEANDYGLLGELE